MLTLIIANKLYSSWSLRPWLVLRAFDIPFREVLVPFSDPIHSPEWKAEIRRYAPSGTVPALTDGEIAIWDSLAIVEYLADRHPELAIWPRDRGAPAMARAMSCEMHAGFTALRRACPMNLGKRFAERDRGEAVAANVARITELWALARDRFGEGGPFLFGAFSAADAMYAPVVTRLDTYAVAVDPASRAYMNAVLSHSAFQEWREAALQETWTVPEDEVDESPVEILRKVG